MSSSSLSTCQLHTLSGTKGLVFISTSEIPISVISFFFMAIFARKSAIRFFDLSVQSIENASNNSTTSHTANLYCLSLLFFEEYLDLTCETISSKSPYTNSNLIPYLIARLRPSNNALYSAILLVQSNDKINEYLNVLPLGAIKIPPAPFLPYCKHHRNTSAKFSDYLFQPHF